jgi:hypothetical protein
LAHYLAGVTLVKKALRLGGTVAMAIVATGAGVAAARLRPEALAGWQRYVAAVEHRRVAEAHDASRFLAMDFLPGAAEDRRKALAGELVVRSMEAHDARGAVITVESAKVHHWYGAVFLPGVSLDRLIATLESEAPPTGPDVIRSAVVDRAPGSLRVFLRLRRTRIVTVVYDTVHDVRFVRNGPGRASSVSVATKIAEIADPGTHRERELTADDDHGFLWRLNAYWRYEAIAGGVLAECESISLSRDVPFGLQTIAGPLINGAARESMDHALRELQRRQ